MKSLILCISLLALISCSKTYFPAFKAGDCIANNYEKEAWEKQSSYVSKVLQVGDNKYRLIYMNNGLTGKEDTFNYIRSVDRIMEKVECPKTDVEINYEQ